MIHYGVICNWKIYVNMYYVFILIFIYQHKVVMGKTLKLNRKNPTGYQIDDITTLRRRITLLNMVL